MRLTADNLSGERSGETVFSGVAFSLGRGESLVVTGPNGAGKSTLLRVLAGLLPAAGGSLGLAGGGDVFPTPQSACHYLGHLNGMKSAMTVGENLCFWRAFLGEPHLDPHEALEKVGLGGVGHLPFGYLSTGQKRRAAAAKLLVSYRPVWLLDEPTAGLDRDAAAQFSALIVAHLENGGIVVAATHLPLGLDTARELRMGSK